MSESVLLVVSLVLLLSGAVFMIRSFHYWKSGERFFVRGELWSTAAMKRKYEGNGYFIARVGGILAGLGGVLGVVFWGSRLMH